MAREKQSRIMKGAKKRVAKPKKAKAPIKKVLQP